MRPRQTEHARINKGSMLFLDGVARLLICMENRQNAA
jgi:hypothetical protein